MRISNYASWCDLAYTWSKITPFEWCLTRMIIQLRTLLSCANTLRNKTHLELLVMLLEVLILIWVWVWHVVDLDPIVMNLIQHLQWLDRTWARLTRVRWFCTGMSCTTYTILQHFPVWWPRIERNEVMFWCHHKYYGKVMYVLKVLGKSVGLYKTRKRKDQLYITLLVSVWRIICENFNPNGLILAEIWMKI